MQTTTFKCDECGLEQVGGIAFTMHSPGRLGEPSNPVHACSERCAAKVCRLVAARFDERAKWREETAARAKANEEMVQGSKFRPTEEQIAKEASVAVELHAKADEVERQVKEKLRVLLAEQHPHTKTT